MSPFPCKVRNRAGETPCGARVGQKLKREWGPNDQGGLLLLLFGIRNSRSAAANYGPQKNATGRRGRQSNLYGKLEYSILAAGLQVGVTREAIRRFAADRQGIQKQRKATIADADLIVRIINAQTGARQNYYLSPQGARTAAGANGLLIRVIGKPPLLGGYITTICIVAQIGQFFTPPPIVGN